jgi:putative methyltransferase (TIGR04325 family)
MLKLFKKLQLVLPPFLVDFIKKNIGYVGYAIWEYSPEGFNKEIKKKGWDLESIAALQNEKWDGYSKRIKSTQNIGVNHENSDPTIPNDPFFHNLLTSFAYVIMLSGLKKDSIDFLDWGGGIGHYGLLAEELIKPAKIKMNYFCYDFPVFCKKGETLNPNYNYFHNENQYHYHKFDLIMASSSIWYEEDWKKGVDKLCNFETNFLYITRMIFINKKPSYVAVQRPKSMGYDTEYLFWVINKIEFINYLKEKNFELIREFEFGVVTPIFKGPEQGTMKGFLFQSMSL